MKKYLLFFLLLAGSANYIFAQKTILVNPFIGTDAHGHTYPGAVAPFGQVQLSPDTRLDGWDGCSGYHWTDKTIYGFSHTHLSGTGCSDFCDILFIPTTSIDLKADHSSDFKKEHEKAEAGLYKVHLDKYNISVELTATQRCGWHKYTYLLNMEKAIIVDLKHRDELLDCSWSKIDENTIVGKRISKAWNEEQVVYFAAHFSKPLKKVKYDNELNRLLLTFGKSRKKNNTIEATVALSSVNEDGALKNLKAEKSQTFEQALKEAHDLWENELSKIKIEGGSFQNRVKFYTALYHSTICPNLYSDVNGKYLGMDKKIHSATGYNRYHVFSLWDTYRTLHPLLAIIDTKRSKEFALTFLDIYKQSGLLPMWELGSWETYCMIGQHGASVLADLYLKGLVGNDKYVLEALINTLDPEKRKINLTKMGQKNYHYFGLDMFDKYGFIPSEKEHESVSKTLEYSYNMYCVAQVAKAMKKQDIYEQYIAKAQYYKNLFNPKTNFIEPKENNRFLPNFDPRQIDRNYTEGNGWHYTFYVPQDIETLKEMMGGDEAFVTKLDSCFFTSSQTTGRKQADVTGLIGQYAHGNEPSQHTAYLYAYAGAAYKTQKLVRLIMDSLYTYSPNGLCGNDDAGQMSAWFVMSALGFYPVNPVSHEYVLGSPLFDKAIIHLESGKTFTITAKDAEKKKYVHSVSLNGHPYNKAFITYEQIMAGGNLTFEMSEEPNPYFASSKDEQPSSKIEDNLIVPVPYVEYEGTSSFSNILDLTIKPAEDNDSIVAVSNKNDGVSDVAFNFKDYKVNLLFDRSCEISAASINDNGKMSKMITSKFVKIPSGRSIKIYSHYDNQYSAGGDFALIDKQKGSDNWRLGSWQGYQGEDVVCVVDLGKETSVKRVGANFIQDAGAWIFMPVQVKYSYSMDGENYTTSEIMGNPISEKETVKTINTFYTSQPVKCRYLRLEATNRKTNPEWHISAGEPSWLFIDEIEIEEE
ncbi:MAG: GH92 family glycosyl hydrolase [Bacteroidales bacterium]|jgi:predicted alpha-1,2-mannosidase|nr:GH92 family glycosyl hydrolase [Bacteroidales bacterium]